MPEAYPWGAQAPAARLARLKRDLEKNIGAKAAYLESHKAKIAELDETDRSLKSDIRACEAVIDREQREQQSDQLSKMIGRLAASGRLDIGALLSDPDLEKKLVEVTKTAGGKSKAKKDPAEAGANA